MAEEVEYVDMRDRVLTGSRRLGIKRAVVVGAALTVVLGGGVAGAATLMGPSSDGSAPPASGGSPDGFDGALYYVDRGREPGEYVTVVRQDADGAVTIVKELSDPRLDPVVSPDGRYAVWTSDPAGTEHTVVLLDMSTGETTDLYDITTDDFCRGISWATDGEPVIAAGEAGDSGNVWTYNVETGESSPPIDLAAVPDADEVIGSCRPLAVPGDDGYDLYLTVGDGNTIDDVVRMDPQGGRTRLGLVDPIEAAVGTPLYALTGLSADGARGCFAFAGTETDRSSRSLCDVQADMATGEVISRSDGPGSLDTVFLPDTTQVDRHDDGEVEIRDADGAILASTQESEDLRYAMIETCVP